MSDRDDSRGTRLHSGNLCHGSRWSGRAACAALMVLPLVGCGGSGDGETAGLEEPGPVVTRASCAALAKDPFFASNPQVLAHTVTTEIVAASDATSTVPSTPAFCRVAFTYGSGLGGPQDGYDEGQRQLIQVRVFLPLSAADGGSGNAHGNWNGKQMVGASGGNSGDPDSWASFAEGTTGNDFKYAIRLGYVGSNTDTGQRNPPYAVITTGQRAGTLATGTILDWESRATHYGKTLAAQIANIYYGAQPTRTYFNGCSGAGNQGLGQLQDYGADYDGALIGAPANYRNERFLGNDSWPLLVWKKVLQQGGAIPTTAQSSVINAAALASCDVLGNDMVADGIISDPRACTFSAKANICGTPGAPDAQFCLTALQADAIDRIWDGPRNRFGDRVYFGWSRGIDFPLTTALSSGASGAGPLNTIRWNHLDQTLGFDNLFSDPESLSLAGNLAGGLVYDDEVALGSNTIGALMANRDIPGAEFQAKGGKVIHLHGMQDGLINWQQSMDYYRRTATVYGKGTADLAALGNWYRFFPQPGVGHCTGGAPSAVDPFLVLVDWVENGKAPEHLVARSETNAAVTRKICPYPQTAVYRGAGSIDDAQNYSCSGSLDTQRVLCDTVRTKFRLENTRNLDFASLGIDPAMCPSLRP